MKVVWNLFFNCINSFDNNIEQFNNVLTSGTLSTEAIIVEGLKTQQGTGKQESLQMMFTQKNKLNLKHQHMIVLQNHCEVLNSVLKL